MLNNEVLALFKYIFFIYISGFTLFTLFFKNVYKKNNLFINIAISFAIGNLILIICLNILAFSENLNIITNTNLDKILLLLGTTFTLNFIINFKKLASKPNLFNWLFLIFFILFFKPLIIDSLISYLINWDPIAMWFLKAKTFYLSKGVWSNNFYFTSGFEYSNKPYPIGLPLIIAGFYKLAKQINDQLIQFYFVNFYLNLVFLFIGFIKTQLNKLTNISHLIITLILFCLPNFMIYAHSGYADMIISLNITLATSLFILFLEEKDIHNKFGYLILNLIVSSFGIFIKNEAIPFWIMVNALSFFIYFKFAFKNKEKILLFLSKTIIFILNTAVILLPIILWEFYKKKINMPFYLDNAQIITPLAKIKMIVFHFMDEFLRTTYYSIVSISVFIILIFQSIKLFLDSKFDKLIPFILILIQLAIYGYVYLITTVPLKLQLDSSFERLFLHILPALYIVIIYHFKVIDKNLSSE